MSFLSDAEESLEVECEECGCPLFVRDERDENGNPWWCDNCALAGT